MKKGLSLALVVIMSLAVLLTGCGNSEQVESNSESSSTAQIEDTSSSEAESSSEPETPEESDFSTALESQAAENEQNDNEPESSFAAQAEAVPSSESVSSSEPETSEQNTVPEEPEESDSSTAPESGDAESQQVEEENSEMQMNVQVGGSNFTATLEENAAVDALVEMMEQAPVTIQMRDYKNKKKVGPLGTSLPTSNQQTTTQAGDIVLYQGNQIVIFYGSNAWSYTRLAKIDDLAGWEEALGSGDVTVTLSLAN